MRRLALALSLVAAALVTGVAGADAPTITVPADMTVEATSAAGALVSYTASATNSGGHPVDLSCSPPDGAQGHGSVSASAQFALGPTTVTCTVADSTGTIVSQASFTVTVTDTTPPTLTLPASFSVAASSPQGATVSYQASAQDLVDGAVTPSCTPASGSLFPLGTTTVTCSAADAHGNTAGGSFTVSVAASATPPPTPPPDTTPPLLSGVPAPLSVEATGQDGAFVSYVLPTATDAIEGPIATVICTPPPGSVFPLGRTTVSCSASDAAGNTATATFTVTVVDTTPPALSVPGPTSVYASDGNGIAASAPTVAAFLSAAVARDSVDRSPTIKTDAPAAFPLGQTTVTFTATDAAGNKTSRSSTLTVVAPPPGTAPPPPLPPPVVPAPPPDATNFAAIPARGQIVLRWTPPNVAGFDHIELSRADATPGAAASVVYRGPASTFTDRTVQASHLYRYQLVVVDKRGDRSAGVALTAFAQSPRILAPREGANLRRPPQLAWVPSSGASYYNVQLFRDGVKVLSVWPRRPRLNIASNWRYGGRSYRLTPGLYRWYVWPGFGSNAARRYGPLLGEATFTIVP